MSTPAPSGGLSAGSRLTRLRAGLPTPLTHAVRDAVSRAGDPGEQLSRRIWLVDHYLRWCVAIQDAELRLLHIESPKEVTALLRRLDRPTLGLWATASQAQAQALARLPVRPLPPVAAALADTPQSPFIVAVSTLIAVRNELAHSADLGRVSPQSARGLLDRTQQPLRTLLEHLTPWTELSLVVPVHSETTLSGHHTVQLQLYRGEVPTLVPVRHVPAPPALYRPAFVTQDGVMVSVFPWIACDRRRSEPGLLVLRDTRDGAPTYTGPRGEAVCFAHTAHGQQPWPTGGLHAVTGAAHTLQPLPQEARAALAQPASPAPSTPPQLDGFTVVRRLGRGGSGTVWLVEDSAGSGDRLAAKVLHPALSTQRAHLARLEREHRLLHGSQLSGVVAVRQILPHPELGPVLLMEWIDGRSLAQVVTRGPVPEDTAVHIARDLLHTLHHVHERGIVHRDIKPSNVLLDARNKPHLIDFGVAWVDDGQQLTATADFVGTRRYAAPEQLEGRPIDHRADLYAVGRLLQTLISGEDTPATTSRAPGRLAAVLRRALQPEPADRFQTAADLAEALATRHQPHDWPSALDPGERLPSGLRIERVTGEPTEGLLVHTATTQNGEPAAILAPRPSGAHHARLYQVIQEASAALKREHGVKRIETTQDGVPYVELWPDHALNRARALIGLPASAPAEEPSPAPTPEDNPTPEGESQSSAAAAAAAAALGAGALLLGAFLGRSKSSAPAIEPPADSILAQCHHIGLLLFALYAAATHAPIAHAQWRRAWTDPLGGLLALPTTPTAASPLHQALDRSPARRRALALARHLAQLSRRPEPTDPQLHSLHAHLRTLLQDVFPHVVLEAVDACPWLHRAPPALPHTLLIKRVHPANTWQAVAL